MSYNLFLDDHRSLSDAASYMHPDIAVLYRTLPWVIVTNYKQFTKYIRINGLPDMISFDHDLGDVYHYKKNKKLIISPEEAKFDYDKYTDKEKTGFHCAKWLVNYCTDNNKELPKYIVHSSNGVGAANIDGYLKSYLKFKQKY